MDPKTKQLVEDAEALVAKVPDGPWHYCLGGVMDDQEEGICIVYQGPVGLFIASARTLVPSFCSVVREQDNLINSLRAHREALGNRCDQLEEEKDDALSLLAKMQQELDLRGKRIAELEEEVRRSKSFYLGILRRLRNWTKNIW